MTLVFKGSVFLIRRHELTAGIALIFDFAIERRTIGVHVEYGKEDSYLNRRLVEIFIIKNSSTPITVPSAGEYRMLGS